MLNNLANLEELVMPIILSIFGGIVRTLQQTGHTFRDFVRNCITSGFAGLMVYYLVSDSALSTPHGYFVVGMSGFGGIIILDVLLDITKNVLLKFGYQVPVRNTWDGVDRRCTCKEDENGKDS